MTDVTCHIFRLWSIWFVWPLATIQIYNLLLFYNYRLCRSWNARNCLAELHHAETLSDFRLAYVGVVSHGDACVSHARPTNHVFTLARKPIASMVVSLTCQVFKRHFLLSISIDKERCIFVPIVRQNVTTCGRNDTDVRGNDIPIKVESVERVGRFKSVKYLAINFDLNAL